MNFDQFDEEELNGCLNGLMKVGVIIILLVSAICLGGCKSVEYVPVPEVHTDTLYISKTKHDSIYVKDSIYVHEWVKGDTVYIEQLRWQTKWRERLRTDTIRESRVDSVAVPYPVERVKTKTNYSGWFAFFALLIVCAGGWIVWRKIEK